MIKTEIFKGGKLIRHYSDTSGIGVLQTDTGILYSEAVDVNPCSHTYEEAPLPYGEQQNQYEGDILCRIENLELRMDNLELPSGGSVKPGGNIPFDPKPGGSLTIGG